MIFIWRNACDRTKHPAPITDDFVCSSRTKKKNPQEINSMVNLSKVKNKKAHHLYYIYMNKYKKH